MSLLKRVGTGFRDAPRSGMPLPQGIQPYELLTDDERSRIYTAYLAQTERVVVEYTGHRVKGVAPDRMRCQGCRREWWWSDVERDPNLLYPACPNPAEDDAEVD